MLMSRVPQRTALNLTAAVITCAVAAATATLSVFSLHAALVPLIAVVGLAVLALDQRAPALFLACLGLLLVGYAFAGRGFAYLGVAPVYLSEIVLFLSALVLLIKLGELRLSPLHLLLLLFMAWGLVRTVPYLQRDGLNALRDAVLWFYALFAIAVSFVVRRHHLELVSGWFARIAPLFVLWVPVLVILYEGFHEYLPLAPGSKDATIPYFNPGDIAVHLAGAAAFMLVGLQSHHRKFSLPQVSLLGFVWLVGFAMCSAMSRGAFLAGFVALAGAFLIRPSRLWLPFVSLAVSGLLLLAIINPTFEVEERQRNVSVGQLLRNASSIVTDSNDGALEPTRRWRIAWWEKIVDYTVTGPYFWTGKGFGVNLADSDGFQVFSDHSLRSPHNTHLTILARMGVPGFVMWVALNVIFAAGLWQARKQARATGDGFRSAFIAWLLLYWFAMSVNGAFSLYLEAPQQGIWYWTVFGLGLAVMRDTMSREVPVLGGTPQRSSGPFRRQRLVPAQGYALSSPAQAVRRPAAIAVTQTETSNTASNKRRRPATSETAPGAAAPQKPKPNLPRPARTPGRRSSRRSKRPKRR